MHACWDLNAYFDCNIDYIYSKLSTSVLMLLIFKKISHIGTNIITHSYSNYSLKHPLIRYVTFSLLCYIPLFRIIIKNNNKLIELVDSVSNVEIIQ
jgi:hypothetical protein